MDFQNSLTENGFLIINNVFRDEEIANLRNSVTNYMNKCDISFSSYGGKTQPNAACVLPNLAWIFYHPKVLSIMRELLQTENIMFTSHCDVHSRTLSGWHKDDGMMVMEGGYFEKPSYNLDDCQVYKIAIYLQDHYYNLGGLRVRSKSHRLSTLDQGEEVYLRTKAGDIVIFDVRLTHTGQTEVIPVPWLLKPIGLLTRVLHKLFRIPYSKFNSWLKTFYDSIAGDRLSIFFTFGYPNEYTIKFAQNNMRRQLAQDPKSSVYLPKVLRQQLLENGVLLAEDYFSDLKPLETIKR